MPSVNKCTFVGRLGKDVEIRAMQNGGKVASFSIACSENWPDKQTGERREKTEWIPIVVFNEGLVKVAEQYLKKGMLVFVEGAFQTRKWQDQSGADRYSTEIVLQKFRGEIQMLSHVDEDKAQQSYGEAKGKPAHAQSSSNYAALDDEIPFNPEFR